MAPGAAARGSGKVEAAVEHEASILANGSHFEDRYEILGVLGSGSFGRVYRARQLSTGRRSRSRS